MNERPKRQPNQPLRQPNQPQRQAAVANIANIFISSEARKMLNSDVVMWPITWVYVRMKEIVQVGNLRESTVDVDLLKQLIHDSVETDSDHDLIAQILLSR